MDLAVLRSELTRDEGLRLKPYTDSTGHLTIGVGRNLTDNGISKEEASYLLSNDIAAVMTGLDRMLPWWEDIDPVRQRVIVNMAFNLGIAKLLDFQHTLQLAKAGFYESAADSMLLSLWARQVGPRAVRLADLMRSGKDPTS